jgi:hypothetical protein
VMSIVLLTWLVIALPQTSLAQHTERYNRPIPMGVSISAINTQPYITSGTAGMLVHSISNPSEIYILSNNHVLGAIGPLLCPNTAPIGTEILQPGSLDLGFDPGPDPFFVVAQLARFVPIEFRRIASNVVDAAIARTDFSLSSPEILGIGFPGTEIGQPFPGMNVIKSGRTTGVTTGSVETVHASLVVRYGRLYCRVARFVDQTVFSNMSDSGDSGSVILEAETLKPVALLFAGSGTNTIGNPFPAVLEALDVYPVGSDGATADPASAEVMMKELDNGEMNPNLQRLREIQQRHESRILGVSGVTGIGIGLSEGSSNYGFVIYCEKLGPVIKKQIAKEIEGVPVRLKESGVFEAY